MTYGFDVSQCPNAGNIKVGWGQAKMASNEATLSTEGLACCIGVAIYDPDSANGYLAHTLASARNHLETVVPIVQIAQARAPKPSGLLAWVRGGTLTGLCTTQQETEQILRIQTLKLLGGIDITGTRLDAEWNDDPYLTVNMALSCESGKIITCNPRHIPKETLRSYSLNKNPKELKCDVLNSRKLSSCESLLGNLKFK